MTIQTPLGFKECQCLNVVDFVICFWHKWLNQMILYFTHYPLQMKLLWLKLIATHIYEYKHKYLEGSLTTYLFNKITIRSLLCPTTSPNEEFVDVHSTRYEFSPSYQDLNSIMKVFSYPHKSLFSVVPVESSCLVGWFYSMKGVAMAKTNEHYSLLSTF